MVDELTVVVVVVVVVVCVVVVFVVVVDDDGSIISVISLVDASVSGLKNEVSYSK